MRDFGDISLYAYTHVAAEGGFDLTAWPAIGEWFARLEALPNHFTMAKASARMSDA